MKLHMGLFAISVLVTLIDPTAAFGFALGWEGFLIVATVTGVSCFLAAALWTGIFEFVFRFEKPVAYGILVLTFTQLIAWPVGQGADREWRIGEVIHTNKIEYHCGQRFNPQRCVQLVVACPDCVSEIPKWKRQTMTANLKQISF